MTGLPPLITPVLESLERHSDALDLRWSDGQNARYHFLWLRDNCPSNFHPDTQERTFDLLSVSDHIHPLLAEVQDNALVIDWSEGEHQSRYPASWLRQHAYAGSLRRPEPARYQSWDAGFSVHTASADFDTLMSSDQALLHWMQALDQNGLILVTGMPDSEQALDQLSGRIDYQRQTNFGLTFDVRSAPKPINLAYTALSLPLHTDLPNQEIPPGYQFLHCLANECEGGRSVFCDGLRVLEHMREQSPEAFALLAEQAVPFRFQDDEHDIIHHHPMIHLDHQGNIIELKFNAHIATVFDLPGELMGPYYLAYRELMRRVRDPAYQVAIKLQAGQMVVFDNRRVLHGREAFDPNQGRRHLRGCYVDRTEFQSRLRVLQRQASGLS